MYYENTGDLQAREDAQRSLKYATYFAAADGKIACRGLDYADLYWFDDGYGDHVRDYLWAMGAGPDFAPVGENHLLRSSSVVTRVAYDRASVDYTTFDADAIEVFRLRSAPVRVSAGPSALAIVNDLSAEGYLVKPLSDGDVVVRVHHRSGRNIKLKLSDKLKGNALVLGGGIVGLATAVAPGARAGRSRSLSAPESGEVGQALTLAEHRLCFDGRDGAGGSNVSPMP